MIRLEVKSKLNIDKVTQKLPQQIADSMNKVMIKAYNVVRKNAPVDTGRLRSSIHFYKATPNNLESRVQSEIREGVNYAVAVEIGTNLIDLLLLLYSAGQKESLSCIQKRLIQ